MNKILTGGVRLVEFLLVLLISGMALMVFVNVVLRYGFNSGVVISEEMSRIFFIWLTFIGAVVTFHEHGHLGVESLVRVFGRRGRVICMGLTNALIVFCCALLFWGTWLQAPINASMHAPVSGMPMILVFGVGFFTSIGIGAIALWRLVKVVTGRVSEEEIAIFVGDFGDVETLVGRGE
ncbi:TRAP transporter small permease [Pelagibacterium sediminicola]|uniref:TRAP transporter small permease n=1 Tax=Pelagibacterium sediminicola TaxID=2248761 RepID=UPI003CCC752E